MKNCEMKLNGNILTITIDISKDFGVSSSGKSIIIGSTEGNVSIPDKEDIKIDLRLLDGASIHKSASHKKLKLLSVSKTLLTERRRQESIVRQGQFLPA